VPGRRATVWNPETSSKVANRPDTTATAASGAVRGTQVELDLWPVVNLFAHRGGAPRLLIEVDI
jgi:hypothetical protein